MRILFLLTQDLASPSGLGRYWPLARSLAKRGHQVRIAALHPNWQALPEKHLVNDGVTIDYVAPMHVIKVGSQKKYYSPIRLLGVALQATWALSRAAFGSKADIIHVGKPHPMNGMAGWLASRIKSIPLCVDCDDYEAGSTRFEGRWQSTGVAFFEKRLPRLAQLVTTNTLYMQSMLAGWGCRGERIFYLSNGYDRDRFDVSNPEVIRDLRERLDLSGKQVVLYLGSLSLASHPVDLLIKAFASLTPHYPAAVLLMVGGGEDFQTMIDLAKSLGIGSQTRFTGRVEPNEAVNYYRLAAISIDPVQDDNAGRGRSPLKLFESWACGVPFVTGAVGDRRYLLGIPPAGVLVDPAGGFQALANGIRQVLENESLAAELRRRGLEKAEHYTWDHLAGEMEKVYQKLL